ncbi:hypothetical protein BBJ28_00011183 [Nothophytophthora sp. Chile5]|nr:hypothetical protein BBJ28_00011183 [Nothophytophthora sp. Chile5]
MDGGVDAPTTCARAVVKTVVALSLPFVLSPREVAAEAASNVAAAFTSCFSRLSQRRQQFAEEQQESLLSCHSTLEEDARFSEAAMLELRRRVMDSGVSSMQKPRWGPVATDQPSRPSRWKQRKMLERTRAKSNPSSCGKETSPEDESEAFTTLASDTEKALDQILGPVKTLRKHAKSAETLYAEAVRRLSVDELLSRGSSGTNAISSPEKTGAESALLVLEDDDEDYDNSEDTRLREWLAAIDPPRAHEYCVYAKQLEQHGFLMLTDLAQLESDDDVEQAMSEVGIAKFAHRLRIRKAIQRLHVTRDGGEAAAAVSVAVAASA